MKTDKNDNELIAEFMGFERYSNNSFKCPNSYPVLNSMSHGWTTFRADQLEFDTRWDMLMPACLKWDSLPYDQFNYKQIVKYKALCSDLDDFVSCYEIGPVYRQLVKNLKWLSNQIKL